MNINRPFLRVPFVDPPIFLETVHSLGMVVCLMTHCWSRFPSYQPLLTLIKPCQSLVIGWLKPVIRGVVQPPEVLMAKWLMWSCSAAHLTTSGRLFQEGHMDLRARKDPCWDTQAKRAIYRYSVLFNGHITCTCIGTGYVWFYGC